MIIFRELCFVSHTCCILAPKFLQLYHHTRKLFVCLVFFVPLENFSLIRRRYHYRWRSANFDLCPALMAIEQWGFYIVSHLLWHGSVISEDPLHSHLMLSVYQLSYHYLSRLGFEHPTFRMRGKRSNRLRHWEEYGIKIILCANVFSGNNKPGLVCPFLFPSFLTAPLFRFQSNCSKIVFDWISETFLSNCLPGCALTRFLIIC